MAWNDVQALAKTRTTKDPELKRLLDKSRAEIREARESFERLIAVQATAERHNLRGSAMKRLAMIEAAAGRAAEARAAVEEMKGCYKEAEALVKASGSSDLFYPASNYIAAELALQAGERGWAGIDTALINSVSDNLKAQNAKEPEFWSIVGEIELDFYEALNAGRLSDAGPSLEKRYADLFNRMQGGTEWGSVLDTAGFVISNYLMRASGKEAAAARALFKRLAEFAGSEDAESKAARKTRPRKPQKSRVRKKASRPGGGKKSAKSGISS